MFQRIKKTYNIHNFSSEEIYYNKIPQKVKFMFELCILIEFGDKIV